jgi:hypothetical protein
MYTFEFDFEKMRLGNAIYIFGILMLLLTPCHAIRECKGKISINAIFDSGSSKMRFFYQQIFRLPVSMIDIQV